MSEPEVLAALARQPDHTCRIGEMRILYFFRHGPFAGPNKHRDREEPLPREVTDRRQIPDIYDSFQFLVGPDGKVSAISWNGEDLRVHTKGGDYPGDNVSKLPDEFFR
jgi:hypothetical protein